MPQTGPHFRSEVAYWSGNSGPRKMLNGYVWYRNGPGPKYPHYFRMSRTYARSVGADAPNLSSGYWCSSGTVPSYWSSYADDVHNRAYAKFVSQARDGASASLGATMAEWGQSQNMITKRAWQLTQAARYLKRGYPYEFFRELGMLHRMPRRLPNRTDPKKAADLWLEWWFGWLPLFKDLHEATDALQRDIPLRRTIVGKASSGKLVRNDTVIGPYYRTIESLTVRLREKIQARVEVSNPNLYKATQLGLTNPATVLWEIVPFSFVVDWVIPVGKFLEGWTDFLGLTIMEPHTTITRHWTSSYQLVSTWPPGTYDPQPAELGEAWRFERDLHILGPVLSLRPYKGITMTRAATAISLLVQQLNNLKR